MRKFKLIREEDFDSSIKGAIDYIIDTFRDTYAANRLIDNLDLAMQSIEDNPLSNPVIKVVDDYQVRRRNVPNSNYCILYTIRYGYIQLLDFVYSRRDIDALLSRKLNR